MKSPDIRFDSKEADLNYAVFTYAARCLAENDWASLEAFGFRASDLTLIDQIRLSDLQALSAARQPALHLKVDSDALVWLYHHIRRRRTRELLKLELMKLDAGSEMMASFFGINPHEYSELRKQLGLGNARGKPPALDDQEEHRFWELWVALAKPTQPQQLRSDDLWLVIGREALGTSGLRSAWNTIQRWAHDPHALEQFRAFRARWTDAAINAEELRLRQRHGIFKDSIEPVNSKAVESLPPLSCTAEIPIPLATNYTNQAPPLIPPRRGTAKLMMGTGGNESGISSPLIPAPSIQASQ